MRGFDGHKKIKGRKRHIVVDTQGYPIGIEISAANTHDKHGLAYLMKNKNSLWSHLMVLLGDQAYQSPQLIQECKRQGLELKIVKRVQRWDTKVNALKTVKGFVIRPTRWVVERTFAWIGRFRRFSKDYEFYPWASCLLMFLSVIRLILTRLTTGGDV